MEITLRLPDKLYEQAKHWAAMTQQDLDEALTDVLSVALTPVYTSLELEKQVSSLSDSEVLAQSKTQMEPAQGQRLSSLLQEQREDELTEEEKRELFALGQLYQRLLLRQSEALTEAVHRNLLPPLHS